MKETELLKVKIISELPLKESKFIKTSLIEAQREDGRKIFWEMDKGHDTVHILVDNLEENRLELVSQVRVPLKFNFPETDGVAYEACAGLIDKDISIKQIAKEELLEEMGYDVELDEIIPVRNFNGNVGKSGNTVNTFFCGVDNSMKVNGGGGLESEDIKIINIDYDEVSLFIMGEGRFKDIFTDGTTLFLVQHWFTLTLANILKNIG